MSYILAGIFLYYFLPWCVRKTNWLACYFQTLFIQPTYNWSIHTVRRGRHAQDSPFRPSFFLARTLSSLFHMYHWLDRQLQDLMGSYLLIGGCMSMVIVGVGINENKDLFSYLFILLFSVILWPTLFAVVVSEPLGLLSTSHRLGRWAGFTYRRDRQAGALFSAIRAWEPSNNSDTSERQKTWLLKQLASCNQKSSATAICRVLLSWQDIPVEQLKGQLKSFHFIDSRHCPRRMLSRTGLLLVALESSEGNWKAVKKWSGLWLRKAPSPDLLFFYLAARCMGHKPFPGRGVLLFFALLLTFNRRYIPFWQLARMQQPVHARDITAGLDLDAPIRETGLQCMLHVHNTTDMGHPPEVVSTLARYFEALLVIERTAARHDDPKLQALDEVEESLSVCLPLWNVKSTQHSCDPGQSLLLENSDRDVSDSLQSLHYSLSALRNRYEAGRYLESELEWQEWGGIIAYYSQAEASSSGHFHAYQQSISICWNWASWLWNSERERGLAVTVFAWILHEARIYSDYDTMDSIRKNIRTILQY